MLPEIKEYLSKTGWVKNLPFAKMPKIDFIKPSQIATVIDDTGKLQSTQDITPMGLANLAIDLAGDEKVVDNILDKIVDGLRS